jgi:hypothetical protein
MPSRGLPKNRKKNVESPENMTTNAPKKKRTGMSRFYSPTDLAAIFSAGVLIGRWTTQTAAADELEVPQSKLSRGVSVASLPHEILNLFSSPKAITDYGAKTLLEILASDGLSVMLTRANHYAESVNDKRTHMVLAALRGRKFVRADASKRLQPKSEGTEKRFPADVAKEFHEGKARGEWSTVTGGAVAMGLPRGLVNRAVLIAALPREVKALFFLRRSLTFGVGTRLLEIKNELGLIQMANRARGMDGCSDTRSSRNVIDELRRNPLPDAETRVRVTRDRGNKFLKIECHDAALLLKYRKEIEEAVRLVLLKRLRTEEFVELDTTFSSKLPYYDALKRR